MSIFWLGQTNRLDGQVDGEEEILPGAVQVDRQLNLPCLFVCKYKKHHRYLYIGGTRRALPITFNKRRIYVHEAGLGLAYDAVTQIGLRRKWSRFDRIRNIASYWDLR